MEVIGAIMALVHALISLVHRRGGRNCVYDGMSGVCFLLIHKNWIANTMRAKIA